MANDLPDKGPATSSPPASSSSPPPPSSPSSAVDSYIGSFISLTSKYEIRYEGILYHLNPQESTLGLKNVRSYGSEGRRKDGPQIAPGDKVYEYILFRGSDIKDLQVKTVKPLSPGQKEEDIHSDPAIIQSQSLVGAPSSSKPVSISGAPGGSLTQSTTRQGNASGNTVHPGTLPSYQSRTPLGFEGSQQAMEKANLAPGDMPMSAPDLNGRPSNLTYPPQLPNSIAPISAPMSLPATYPPQLPNSIAPISAPVSLSATYPPQLPNSIAPISAPVSLPTTYPPQLPNPIAPISAPMSLPATVQSYSQPSVTPATTAIGLNYSPNVAPSPSLTSSNSLQLNDLATYTPDLHSTLSGMPSSLSGRVSVPSHPALPVANRISTFPFGSSLQDMNAMEAPFVEKRGNDPFSFQSLPFSAPSYNTAGPLPTPQHNFPAPDQFLQHRESLLSNVQKPFSGQRDMLAMNSGPAHFSSSGAMPINQAPILPSLLPLQQPQPPMPKFTEEFDFEAMNEKFKKEEVWGYLGGVKQGDLAEGSADNSAGQNSGDGKGDSSTAKPKPQTAYKKDDFFDTLSGNTHGRGVPRNGPNNRFSERPRHNTENFGGNYHGNQPGYGGYVGGRGQNYWGPNNWGRGYNNYNGRGRGAYWDM